MRHEGQIFCLWMLSSGLPCSKNNTQFCSRIMLRVMITADQSICTMSQHTTAHDDVDISHGSYQQTNIYVKVFALRHSTPRPTPHKTAAADKLRRDSRRAIAPRKILISVAPLGKRRLRSSTVFPPSNPEMKPWLSVKAD